jgi:hypothetical protein
MAARYIFSEIGVIQVDYIPDLLECTFACVYTASTALLNLICSTMIYDCGATG